MRDYHQNNAVFMLFSKYGSAYLPLANEEKLLNPDFPVPISFILGDRDWVTYCDYDDENN